jgi:hypothetical protein
VECAFGILSNTWRIFQRPLNVSPGLEVVIVKAGVVMHNFVRERDGYKFEDALTVTGLEDVPDGQSVQDAPDGQSVQDVPDGQSVQDVPDGQSVQDVPNGQSVQDVPDGQSVRRGLTANGVRNKVADCFVTDAGAASWQMSKI